MSNAGRIGTSEDSPTKARPIEAADEIVAGGSSVFLFWQRFARALYRMAGCVRGVAATSSTEMKIVLLLPVPAAAVLGLVAFLTLVVRLSFGGGLAVGLVAWGAYLALVLWAVRGLTDAGIEERIKKLDGRIKRDRVALTHNRQVHAREASERAKRKAARDAEQKQARKAERDAKIASQPAVNQPRSHGFHTKLVGVTHDNEDGRSRQKIIKRCRVGERLGLVRDPDNRYDRNAVKVCRHRGAQLGFLAADLAEETAPLLDQGTDVDAEITDLTGGTWGKRTRGVNIRISYVES